MMPNDAQYKTKVKWTTDSGVRKSLLSEKHFGLMLYKNPEIKLRSTRTRFRPYSTKSMVPLLGCCNIKLRNEMGKAITTTVYVTEHEKESLLGKEDAIKLGILKISPKGEPEDAQEEKA